MNLNKRDLKGAGRGRLEKIKPTTEGIATWKGNLTDYRFHTEYSDDAYVWLTCILALEAVGIGNFGIGCILVNGDGDVVARGHNEVFVPHFRSDRHAEMVVMDEFEDAHTGLTRLEGYALYTSLEPCPMCTVRLSSSGVSRVLFAAPDATGGMISRLNHLPPFWLAFAQGKAFGQARCSPNLVKMANQILLLNLDELTAKMKARFAS